jgi:anthranilate synthase component 1
MTHGPELRPFPVPDATATPLHLSVTMDDATYGERVERAKEYIRAGDAFQIVLARTFTAPARNADPFDVYRALRVLSPSPYLYFLDFAETPMSEPMSNAGASPETMVRVEHGRMFLRPIAGTRPRGDTEAEDTALCEALLADPKERAEHVMLIDLARNDLGRVCVPGSVDLTQNMGVERYSHVMHIVSEVTGKLLPGLSYADVLRATFPAGTVSGAPKIRALEVIRELEPIKRNVYAGSIGYIGWHGDADTAIAIRTAVIKDGRLHVQAGAGIVYDSDPEKEWDETMNKGRALFRAVAEAARGL